MAQLIRATVLAVAALAPSLAGATCLRYEPAQVTLTGRLAIGAGGRLALKLDRPICVLAGSGTSAAEGVRIVKVQFQMVRATPVASSWVGHRAAASGSLYRGPHDHDGELSLLVTGFGRTR